MLGDSERVRGRPVRQSYRGIDFGLSAQGKVLLLEATATMVVERSMPGKKWDHLCTAAEHIHTAVPQMD